MKLKSMDLGGVLKENRREEKIIEEQSRGEEKRRGEENRRKENRRE